MLSPKLQDALNAQINAELWSAYLYLSMSTDAQAKGNKGMANWFNIQFKEEQAHAQIFMNYVYARGGKVTLAPIDAVQTEWDSALAIFEDTLAHEIKVTALINNLCRIAADENDFATSNMLMWFIAEQVEEEESVLDIIDSLKKVEGAILGLYMIDKELGNRVYVAPSLLKE